MLGALFNAIGIITVKEDGNAITVRGVNGHRFEKDIVNHWNTSKIYNNIFKKSSSYGFEIDSFFAIELLYVLRKIVNDGGKIVGSRRQYKTLIDNLIQNTWLRSTEGTFAPSLDYDALNRFTIKLFDHQDKFIRTYDDRSQRYRLNGYILGAAPGSGKALVNCTPVKVPTGWKNIGDLRVDDLVATPDGTYTPVTGVYPQGKVQLYIVEFADGRVAECCAEHLWKYHDHNTFRSTEWAVANTEKLIERLAITGNRLYVPLVKAVGDVNVKRDVPDCEAGSLVARMSVSKKFDLYLRDMVNARLMGITDIECTKVKLPDLYTIGHQYQRRLVIQGIMDTCGTISESGTIKMTTFSKELALQTQKLLWSIGGIAKYSEKGEEHCLTIRVRYPHQIFHCNEKRELVSKYCKDEPDLKLGIKSITLSGRAKATCISVADPERLFVIKDHIVTHNTIINFALSECLNTDTTIVLVPKNSIDKVWKDTIESIFKQTPTYWVSSSGEPITPGKRYYMGHYEQLENILNFARKNNLGRVNIALDESHNFNDLKSARTQMFCELVKVTKSVCTIFASGTPVKAMGSEVVPILRSIDRFFTSHVEERYKKVFGLSSSKGLDILANRMGLITYRVEKANVVGNTVHTYDVDVKTPTGYDYTLDKIRVIMSKFIEERMKYYKDNLKMFYDQYFQGLSIHESTLKTSEEWVDYRKYRNYASTINKGYDPMIHVQEAMYCNSYEKNKIIPNLPGSLKESFKNARSVYKYYHLKVQGEALGRILGRMRTQCNVDMIHSMDNYKIRSGNLPLSGNDMTLEELINQGTKKTVIFTSYVEVVEELNVLLKERGFNPVLVYGQTNKNLTQMISDFDKNPDLNPIIATYPSLSTAVPLVMANQCVMLNAPFRVHEYEQATSRVDRIGQTEIVNIFNIFLDTGKEINISTRSVDIMSWSKSQVDAIMGINSSSAVSIESVQNGGLTDFDIDQIASIASECIDKDHFFTYEEKNEPVTKKLGW